jgi:hypothetical protein
LEPGPAYVAWQAGTIAFFSQLSGLSRLKSGTKQWYLASSLKLFFLKDYVLVKSPSFLLIANVSMSDPHSVSFLVTYLTYTSTSQKSYHAMVHKIEAPGQFSK